MRDDFSPGGSGVMGGGVMDAAVMAGKWLLHENYEWAARSAAGWRHTPMFSARAAAVNEGAQKGRAKPFAQIGAVAVIPIFGALFQRLGCVDPIDDLMTGYDGINVKLAAALADQSVKGVVLRIASGGGQAAGCPETAARIKAVAKIKPVLAALDSEAYSGAYWLAAAATRITAPEVGGAGSIGAVQVHVEYAAALEKQGVTVSIFRSGAQKCDATTAEKLPEAAAQRMQADIDWLGGVFIREVAGYRRIDTARLRDLVGRTLTAPEAVKTGLIDEILPADEAVAKFRRSLES